MIHRIRNNLIYPSLQSTASVSEFLDRTVIFQTKARLRFNFLKYLGDYESTILDSKQIDESILDQLLLIETTPANIWRWNTWDHIVSRIIHFVLLTRPDLGIAKSNTRISNHVWIHGNAILLRSRYSLLKAIPVDSFRRGFEHATTVLLHLTLYGILIYQLTMPGSELVNRYKTAETNSILALSQEFHHHPYLFCIFAAPMLYGFIQAVITIYRLHLLSDVGINEAKEVISSTPPSIWNECFRWILPTPPINFSMQILYQTIVWQGDENLVSSQSKEKALSLLIELTQTRWGWTRIIAIRYLAMTGYSVNLRDILRLKGVVSDDYLLDMISIKTRAIKTLKCTSFPSRIASFVRSYELWAMGLSPKFMKVSLPMICLRSISIFIQILSIITMSEAIHQYLNCPNKPGLSFTGYQSWSSDYSQSCFDELVGQFNAFPGQPANTLVDVLSDYYFPSGTYALNLSMKGIDPMVLAEILEGFIEKGPTLTSLDISGNGINSADAISRIFPLIPSSVTHLGFGYNNIGVNDFSDANDTLAFSRYLSQLTSLVSLDLSGNLIGNSDSNHPEGTIAIAEGLSMLKSLDRLDLSGNYLASCDASNAEGTIALAHGFVLMSSLTELILNSNWLGYADWANPNGTIAMAKSICQMPSLTSLSIRKNWLGSSDYIDPSGTKAWGDHLHYLSGTLKSIDLSLNQLGSGDGIDSSGTIAVGKGLGSLQSLTIVQLTGNWIGYGDKSNHSGTSSICQSFSRMTNLTSLFIDQNYLGTVLDPIKDLTSDASSNLFNHLEILQILPNPMTNEAILTINNAIQNYSLQLTPIPLGIRSVEDIGIFFSPLTQFITSVNLSQSLDPSNATVLSALMDRLLQYPNLIELDLSRNNIGYADSVDATATIALGQGISKLKTLEYLDLSFNAIGSSDWINPNGTMAIMQAIGSLAGLSALNIRSNWLGYHDDRDSVGTESFGRSLLSLSNLNALDISFNWIGYHDDLNPSGTIAFGRGLSHLVSLETLNLHYLWISYHDNIVNLGTVSVGRAFGHLSKLRSLDFSYNWIANGDGVNSSGTVAIGEGLGACTSMEQLNFNYNNIGYYDNIDPSGTLALAAGITHMKHLTSLNFGLCGIGWESSIGDIAFCNATNQLPFLQSLDIGGNYIGSTNSIAPSLILNVLPRLKWFNVQGLQNASWSEGARILADANNAALRAVCEAEICTGTPLHSATGHSG